MSARSETSKGEPMSNYTSGPGPYTAPEGQFHQGQATPPGHGPGRPVSNKSMVLAAVLAWFLGAFGVHNFYLGQTRQGLIKLAAVVGGFVLMFVGMFAGLIAANADGVIGAILGFVVTAVCFLLIMGVCVWALVEFVLILMRKGRYGVDENGLPLS
ncbi:NINE protein [Corynebacterium frankenforstense]